MSLNTSQHYTIEDCPSLVSITVGKKKKNTMTESNLVEKGFILAHNSMLQPIISGKPQWQEFETSGHIISIVHACLLVLSSIFPLSFNTGPPSLGSTHCRLDLLTSVNVRQPHTDMSISQPNVGNPPLRLTLQVSLACVKLTIKANPPGD